MSVEAGGALKCKCQFSTFLILKKTVNYVSNSHLTLNGKNHFNTSLKS